MLFKTRKKRLQILSEGLYFVLQMAVLVGILYLFNATVCGLAVVNGVSMENTIKDGDILVCRKLLYTPKKGDIIICHTGKGIDKELVKRVIALPGDVVDIQADGVSVNGTTLQEPYVKDYPHHRDEDLVQGDLTYPLTVPYNQYFVMGDNREVSLDSRYSEVGTVGKERIRGQVIFRLYPFPRIGTIDTKEKTSS